MTDRRWLTRRDTLSVAAAAIPALAGAGPAWSQGHGVAAAPSSAVTIVLVHGAWHGGWCWRDVGALIAQAGYRVLTPTLTGMGEREHLSTPTTGVSVHARDIEAVIENEECANVVVVGHSYAGFPISLLTQSKTRALRGLVYLDALVPQDGGSVIPSGNPAAREWVDKAVGQGYRVPPLPPSAFDVPAADRAATAWLERRLTTMPRYALEEAVTLPQRPSALPLHYIACARGTLPDVRAGAKTAGMRGWPIHALDAGHDAMVTAPVATADILLRVCGQILAANDLSLPRRRKEGCA